ncbi:MAG: sensor histidine kinase [Clostridiales bacterium]|nr:sensor histidine kinase [Clostridiales bacterium]
MPRRARPAPLKRKLLAMLLLSSVLVLSVCFIAVYSLTLNALKAQYQQSALNSLTHIRGEIERSIVDIESLVKQLQLDSRVQALLSSDPGDLISDIHRRNDFIDGMNLQFVGRSSLGAIIALTPRGRLIGTSPLRTFLCDADHPFFSTEAFRAIRSSAHTIWIGGYTSNYFTNNPESEYYRGFREPVLICGRAIPDAISNASGGVLLVTVNQRSFSAFFQSFTLPYHSIWLLDEGGAVVWGSDPSAVGGASELDGKLAAGSAASFTAQVDGMDMHVVSLPVRGGWHMVSMIPISYYQRGMQPTLMNMLLIGAIALIVLVALYTLWTVRLTTPLRDMAALIERVAAGNLGARMAERHARVLEYGVIARQFNSMLDSIQSLIGENREIERERQRLEMEALQAQINPHFLFNTITSIRWVAVMTRVGSISEALTHLLRLMSPLFHPKEGEWTIRDECEYLGHYVSLMQLRFGDQIGFSMDVDECALDAPIPRFILQPLLENSYEHAAVGGGAIQIRLSLKQDGDRLALCVSDDGRGISEDRLSSIRREMAEGAAGDAGGIGIANVCRRLRLRYGGDFYMDIDSAPGKGAKIEIRIPAGASPGKIGRAV